MHQTPFRWAIYTIVKQIHALNGLVGKYWIHFIIAQVFGAHPTRHHHLSPHGPLFGAWLGRVYTPYISTINKSNRERGTTTTTTHGGERLSKCLQYAIWVVNPSKIISPNKTFAAGSHPILFFCMYICHGDTKNIRYAMHRKGFRINIFARAFVCCMFGGHI